jgi:hypothetical protein
MKFNSEKSPNIVPPKEAIVLTDQEIEKIKQITVGINVIPEEIRERASSDVVETLQNNHPLNKIWRNEQGEIVGYLAFEDFAPNEAYAKYFASEGLKEENPFSSIPELINQARGLGYTKIHFHGWNERLNKVLSHFGFIKTHTDKEGEYSADHFELRLEEYIKPKLDKNTKEAFENKYQLRLIRQVEETIQLLKPEQQTFLNQIEQELTRKLEQVADFELNDQRKIILKLKLARYLQRHDTIDINTLFDALIETPKFLDKDKGGFDRLLEVHEQKTLEKIAEMRKRKAEQTGNESFNPYEALFQTSSEKYYMARLLNMPHLEQESQYMDHCVGTSDSYINKMKRGDVEILSFRDTEKNEPIITIEYNVRTKTIEQIKKAHDRYLEKTDPYYADFVEALKRLKETEHDNSEKRDFKEISQSELQDINVADYCLLTENGEVSFKYFDPNANIFVLKMGKMDITEQTPKNDAAKIFRIVTGVEIEPLQIATNQNEVNENTVAYVGPLYPNIFKQLPQNIEHVYTKFPEGRILIKEIEIPKEIKTAEQYEKELTEKDFIVYDWAKDILYKADLKQGAGQKIKIIIPTVELLGFPNGATRQEIQNAAKKLGIGLTPLPARIGPELRLQYADQPNGEYIAIDMENITDRDGHPDVFGVYRSGGERGLSADSGGSDGGWNSNIRWAFSQLIRT